MIHVVFFERLRVNADLKEAKLLAKRSIDRIDELIATGNNPPNEADDAAISVFNRIFGGLTGPPQIHVPAITTKIKAIYQSTLNYKISDTLEKSQTRIYCLNGATIEWKAVPDRDPDRDDRNSAQKPEDQETINEVAWVLPSVISPEDDYEEQEKYRSIMALCTKYFTLNTGPSLFTAMDLDTTTIDDMRITGSVSLVHEFSHVFHRYSNDEKNKDKGALAYGWKNSLSLEAAESVSNADNYATALRLFDMGYSLGETVDEFAAGTLIRTDSCKPTSASSFNWG